MRQIINPQMQFGEKSIFDIKFDLRSRDEIPQLLTGLQHIYITPDLRQEVFAHLKKMIPASVDCQNGRPGMDLWKIFVMGTLRLNLNWDYDHLQEMVNNHSTIREMLCHGFDNQEKMYSLQTLKDNVSLLSEEIIEQINQIVVKSGHELIKKNGGQDTEKLRGRCDSFVVETDVHFPTDINLLFDGIRKVIELIAALCFLLGSSLWGESKYDIRQIKKIFRDLQKIKHSTSKDEKKKKEQEERILAAYQAYIDVVNHYLDKAEITLAILIRSFGANKSQFIEINKFITHAKRQIEQIERRIFDGEQIPHSEKVFSLFEEHTEWISKGKAGVPVELGLRVCIVEDQMGFILCHQVMGKLTDDQIAVSIVQKIQKNFPNFKICSFDKGFHSPSNQVELKTLLEMAVLPKKGRLSQSDKEREYSPDFIKEKKQHSAVESGINALEVHGLDKCPDHGIDGFKRYIALAILARNLQQLGAIKRKFEINKLKEAA